jgi:hypothetical protein
LKFYRDNEPRFVRSLRLIQGGDVKYAAEWIDSNSIGERQKRIDELYQLAEKWAATLEQVMENQRELEERFQSVDQELHARLDDYVSRAWWEHMGDGFVDAVTAIAASATAGGPWGLIVEAGYRTDRMKGYLVGSLENMAKYKSETFAEFDEKHPYLVRFGENLLFKEGENTHFSEFQRKFPTVLHEIADAWDKGRLEANNFMSEELDRAKKRNALYLSPSELASRTSDLIELAKLEESISEVENASQTLQEETDAKKQEIDNLGSSRSWIPSDTPNDMIREKFEGFKSDLEVFQETPGDTRTIKWIRTTATKVSTESSIQPPSTRYIEFKFMSDFSQISSNGSNFAIHSPKELWENTIKKGNRGKAAESFGTSLAISIGAEQLAELYKRMVVHEIGDDSRELYEDYIKAELEWFAVRRQFMAHSEVVDIVIRGYIESLYAHINDLLLHWPRDLEKPERELRVLANIPFHPTRPIEVDLTLNKEGYTDDVFLSPINAGRKYRYPDLKIRYGTKRVMEVTPDKPLRAQRVVLPVGFEDEAAQFSWRWTLDVNPSTPVTSLDDRFLTWQGKEKKPLAEDNHVIRFASEVQFSLRDVNTKVKVIH